MNEVWLRIIENLADRVTGPMHFRLLLQPAMAIVYAVISGVKDARAGRDPYFWSLFISAENRAEMLRDGWKSISKVFVLAIILDVVYQIYVQRFVYPGETVIVALTLAIFPYLIVRGLVTRIVR